MTHARGTLTVETFWRKPRRDRRVELVRGELRELPLNGFELGCLVARIVERLRSYVDEHRLGVVVGSSAGFRLGDKTVRAAGVAFVSRQRIEKSGIPTKFYPGAPDFCIEVISPSDSAADLDQRIHDFLSAGAQLLWVVNPRARTVTIYRAGGEVRVADASETLTADIVPGFKLRLAEIFPQE